MTQPLDPELVSPALIVLGAAAVVIPLFHRLRISPVLGFMLVGMAVGPSGLATLADRLPILGAVTITRPERMAPVAALGISMLMFTIGLELSLERLQVMRRQVFGLGLAQFAACALGVGVAAWALGVPPVACIVLALALSMSSTAIVVQVLAAEKRLGGTVGRAILAVLLLQDIAAVPILFGISLAGAHARPGGLVLTVAEAVVVVTALILGGRIVLRPLFRGVARTNSPELFVAACLLVILATSAATEAVGLPMELGALIAGLQLAETEYRRQIEVTIEPFKGLLLGVFLISIGMSIDLAQVAGQAPALLAAGGLLILGKGAVTTILARLFGLRWKSGLQAGLMLGPGGEFGFVVLGLAGTEGLLAPAPARFAFTLAALTMACIPVLSALGKPLRRRPLPGADPARDAALAALSVAPEAAAPRVILAGFGRVGEMVASLLDQHGIGYIAVDNDPDRVAAQRAQGRPIIWADITRIELLRRLHIDTARALVVTMSDYRAADQLVATARAERADLLIVARARDADHAAFLYAAGATDAVPETMEASLQLSEAVLVDLGIAMGPVIATIHEKRAELQAQIRAMAPGATVRPLGRRRFRDLARRRR